MGTPGLFMGPSGFVPKLFWPPGLFLEFSGLLTIPHKFAVAGCRSATNHYQSPQIWACDILDPWAPGVTPNLVCDILNVGRAQ